MKTTSTLRGMYMYATTADRTMRVTVTAPSLSARLFKRHFSKRPRSVLCNMV